MKNGTVQSRVKINEGVQYIVNLSKSRRTHSLVSFVVDHFVERNIRLILIVKVNFRVFCNHFLQVSGRQNLLCCSDLLSAVGNLVCDLDCRRQLALRKVLSQVAPDDSWGGLVQYASHHHVRLACSPSKIFPLLFFSDHDLMVVFPTDLLDDDTVVSLGEHQPDFGRAVVAFLPGMPTVEDL